MKGLVKNEIGENPDGWNLAGEGIMCFMVCAEPNSPRSRHFIAWCFLNAESQNSTESRHTWWNGF
jgi:hypothetical protein